MLSGRCYGQRAPPRIACAFDLISDLVPRALQDAGIDHQVPVVADFAPDAVVLWIADADKEALPGEVMALQEAGLTIEYTADLR